jgi:hypothetical protein
MAKHGLVQMTHVAVAGMKTGPKCKVADHDRGASPVGCGGRRSLLPIQGGANREQVTGENYCL